MRKLSKRDGGRNRGKDNGGIKGQRWSDNDIGGDCLQP